MKLNILDIGGEVVKDDDRYIVKDNNVLNKLVVSSTDLKPGKSTSGHNHPGQEEVYNFVKGKGKMKDIRQKLIELLKGGYCTPQIAQLARKLNQPSTTLHYNIKRLEKGVKEKSANT